jgi:hypothetical protein
MNCLYYSLNKFNEEYRDGKNSVIKNKKDFFKKYLRSLII